MGSSGLTSPFGDRQWMPLPNKNKLLCKLDEFGKVFGPLFLIRLLVKMEKTGVSLGTLITITCGC